MRQFPLHGCPCTHFIGPRFGRSGRAGITGTPVPYLYARCFLVQSTQVDDSPVPHSWEGNGRFRLGHRGFLKRLNKRLHMDSFTWLGHNGDDGHGPVSHVGGPRCDDAP